MARVSRMCAAFPQVQKVFDIVKATDLAAVFTSVAESRPLSRCHAT
jgi:hypothetical protein